MTSTCDQLRHCDSPPESDLEDEQIRKMLGSPLYLQEREASADRSRVYFSFRKKLSVKFISFPRQCREPAALTHQESRVNRHFPTEKAFPQDINQFKEMTKLYSGSLNRKKLRRYSS